MRRFPGLLGFLLLLPLLLGPGPGDVRALLERVHGNGPPLTDAELRELLAALPPEEVRVALVQVGVVVLDRKGRPVPGLQRSDFHLEVDGRERPITWFGEDRDHPFRLVWLVDASGSMAGRARREQLRRALLPLARTVRIEDRIRLVSFGGGRVIVHGGWRQRPLTAVEEAVALPRGGTTAVADALVEAAHLLPPPIDERQAIVLASDGIDNASRRTAREVIDAARQVRAPVYVLAVGGEGERIRERSRRRRERSPLALLRRVAAETGGRFFLVTSRDEARAAALRIRDDLRHQYWLGFHPESAPDGRFHRVRVRVDRPGVSILARSGYR